MLENQNPNHHTDSQSLGKEAGLNYPNATVDLSLQEANRRTVNYLVHRMLWEQQEKIDLDDLGWGPSGNMKVEDTVD